MPNPLPDSEAEIEQRLLADKSFQHILKFAPESQRELMTFELARYFSNSIQQMLVGARVDELENRLKVQFITSHWERLRNETNSWAKYVDRRIAELQQSSKEG